MNKRVYISLPITGFQLEERRAYADKAAGWKRQRRTYMTWRFYLKNKHTRQYDFQKRYSRI